MTNRIENLQISREDFLSLIQDITSIKDVFRKLFNTNTHAIVEVTRLDVKYNINIKQIIDANRIRLHIGKTGHRNKPYGYWTCELCGEIFRSKGLLYKHYHQVHPERVKRKSWCKGLTKDINSSLMKASNTIKNKYMNCEIKPPMLGRHMSDESKKKISQFQRNAIYKRVCKKTSPYVKKDGTVVKLDSSYEIKLANILDELNIEWDRPEPIEWFDKDGGKHHYFPDFRLIDYDLYLDPKNEYCFVVQKEKIEYVTQHYPNVIFMHKEQISKEFILQLISNSR